MGVSTTLNDRLPCKQNEYKQNSKIHLQVNDKKTLVLPKNATLKVQS